MGRTPCCDQVGLKKGRWTAEEDEILTKYIQTHGEGSWRDLPKNAGLLRCGKSCRLRWMNYLRLDVRRGNFSAEEEELIIKLHGLLGNRWSQIAGRLPGRTDNEIKNYWNTHLSRKLGDRGIDPVTHKPFYQIFNLQAMKHANSEQSSTIDSTSKRKKDYHEKGAQKMKKGIVETHSSGICSHSTFESCSQNIPIEYDENPTSSFSMSSLNLWDETFSSNLLPSEMGLFGSFDTDDLLLFDNQLAVSNDNSYKMEDTTDDFWSSFLSNMEPSCYP